MDNSKYNEYYQKFYSKYHNKGNTGNPPPDIDCQQSDDKLVNNGSNSSLVNILGIPG